MCHGYKGSLHALPIVYPPPSPAWHPLTHTHDQVLVRTSSTGRCTCTPATTHHHVLCRGVTCGVVCLLGLFPDTSTRLFLVCWCHHPPRSPCNCSLIMPHVHLSFIPPSCPILVWHSPFTFYAYLALPYYWASGGWLALKLWENHM